MINMQALTFENLAQTDPHFKLFDHRFKERDWDSIMSGAKAKYNTYEANNIAFRDRENLKPLAESLNEWRIGGKRVPFIEADRVNQILGNPDANKMLALYQVYCAEYGGLEDPSAPGSFNNLKNPGLLIKQSRGTLSFLGIGRQNETIDQLTNIAVKTKNPELSALLLKQAGHGIGKSEEIINAILVDSKDKMNEGQYANYIAKTAKSFEELHGQSLDKFLRSQYSKFPIVEIGIVGADKEGKELLTALDHARQRSNGSNSTIMGIMYS